MELWCPHTQNPNFLSCHLARIIVNENLFLLKSDCPMPWWNYGHRSPKPRYFGSITSRDSRYNMGIRLQSKARPIPQDEQLCQPPNMSSNIRRTLCGNVWQWNSHHQSIAQISIQLLALLWKFERSEMACEGSWGRQIPRLSKSSIPETARSQNLRRAHRRHCRERWRRSNNLPFL